MTKNLHNKIETGDRLISWAWRLEYVFVSLGLLVAFSLATSGVASNGGFSDLTFIEWNSLILGLVIWVAVAFTELLKIPVTKGILHSNNPLIKVGASAFLFFICVVTFESMSTGLERSITNREAVVEESRKSILDIDNQLVLIEEQISVKPNLDENLLKAEAYSGVAMQVDAIDEQILQLKDQISNLRNPSASDEINELKSQVSFLNLENDKLSNLIADLRKEYAQKIESSYTHETNEVKGVMRKGKVRKKYEEERATLIRERDVAIAAYSSDIGANKSEINKLNSKLADLSSIDPESTNIIRSYNKKVEKLTQEKSSIYSNIDKRIQEKILAADLNATKVEGLLEKKSTLIEEKNQHIADINENGHDFIYSIAKRIYGVSEVADLTSSQVNTVALFIIVTLAGVVAISGPVLTLIAMSNYLEETKPKKSNGILRGVGKMIADIRRRIRAPKIITEKIETEVEKVVEVVKEVPVEKVVKELVEVPKAYVVKEFVGVPVPTAPEDLPNYEEAEQENTIQGAPVLGGVQ